MSLRSLLDKELEDIFSLKLPVAFTQMAHAPDSTFGSSNKTAEHANFMKEQER